MGIHLRTTGWKFLTGYLFVASLTGWWCPGKSQTWFTCWARTDLLFTPPNTVDLRSMATHARLITRSSPNHTLLTLLMAPPRSGCYICNRVSVNYFWITSIFQPLSIAFPHAKLQCSERYWYNNLWNALTQIIWIILLLDSLPQRNTAAKFTRAHWVGALL